MKDKTCTITKLGICNKYKEVTTTFSKDDRNPGLNFKLKNKKSRSIPENYCWYPNRRAQLFAIPETKIMELTKVLGNLFSAALTSPREDSEQLLSINFKLRNKLTLADKSKVEWTLIGRTNVNEREFISLKYGLLKTGMSPLTIQTDSSKPSWIKTTMCQVTTTGKTWSYQEGGKHINVWDSL